MTRKLPWKRASEAGRPSASSPLRASPKLQTPKRAGATTPTSASVARHRSAALAAINSSVTNRYMVPGDDQYRIVEDELLQTAQRFTTHLHRAEYNRLKLLAKSKNNAAIREIERPVVGPLTSDAKRRRDRAKRLSKQRSVLSAQDAGADGDEGTNGGGGGDSPWVGTNLRGLLNAPRAETRSLAPQTSVLPSLTKAAAGHSPSETASTTPRRRPSHGSFPTPASTGRARHPATPASSSNIASSSSAPSRHAKIGADVETPDDEDLDFDDPFGLNKRRLDRQKSRDQLKRSIRSTPSKTPSSSDTMPSFV
ncbi:hypothetical protein PWT90_07248 [Aphanocladium album]|nr:hypothetical protein PWT90_07248 [Aphanocladium album]